MRAVSHPLGALIDAWGRVHPIGRTCTLGRDPDRSDFIISHSSVSRSHALIRCVEPGAFVVRDLMSTNGTFIDRQRISGDEAVLAGQILVIGEVALRLTIAPPAATDRPSPRRNDRRMARTTLASERWHVCELDGSAWAVYHDERVELPLDQWACLRSLVAARLRPVRAGLAQMHGYVRSVDLIRVDRAAPIGEIALRALVRRLRATLSSIGLDDMVHEHERFGYRLRVVPAEGEAASVVVADRRA